MKTRTVVSAFFLRAFGALAILALNLVVSDRLSQSDAGYFLWSFAVVTIVVQVAIMGFHDVALKYAARNSATGAWPELNYFSRKILIWVAGSASCFSAALAVSSSLLIELVFGSVESHTILLF